jgi:CcmD family protein
MRIAAILATVLMLVAPTLVIAQAQPKAAQDEFVPISELPPDDRLPAAPLLIGAYAFVWATLMVYLWSLWRKLGRVEQELAQVTARVTRAGPAKQ